MKFRAQLESTIPRWHQSYAKTLLNGCPRELEWELEQGGRKATKAMDMGSLVDQLVFGGANFHTISADSFRTKVAQQERDTAVANGMIPILAKDLEPAEEAAGRVRSELLMRGIDLDECEAQKQIQWTGHDGVECEGTPDLICTNGTTVDLKCGPRCAPADLEKQCWDMCWDVQGSSYQEAVQGNGEHWIVRAQIGGPGLLTVLRLTPFFLEIGAQRRDEARRIWAECHENNEWPEWPDSWADPPEWQASRWMERMGRR